MNFLYQNQKIYMFEYNLLNYFITQGFWGFGVLGFWDKATGLAQSLRGQFGGELNEFYDLVIDFCRESAKVNLQWDGVKHTVPVEGQILDD